MISKTNSESPRLTVELNCHGLLHALALLKSNPTWNPSLSQTDIFRKFADKTPPAGTRLSDFLKKVSLPFGIPFYVLWVWMCTDFSILEGEDPFIATEKYLKKNLNSEDYLLVTDKERPLNLRKALRETRKGLKLSLKQMADKAGVNKDKISVLERDENDTSMPRCDTLNAVLPFYGLHPLELYVLALKDEQPNPNSS